MLTTAAHVKTKAARCKHDKKDVFIFIDAEHTIYADDEEHVPGDVCFFAAVPCTLYFEKNNPVFPQDQYSLLTGINWLTLKGKGSTHYAINETLVYPTGGPIIVVP